MDRRSLTVISVGDIMLGDNHLHIGRGVGSTWRKHSLTHLLRHLTPELAGDVVIGNLECVLGKPSSRCPKDLIYIAPESRAKQLRMLGFTHLGMANNHILQHGEFLAKRTRSCVELQGIHACGTSNPTSITIRDISIDIFTYSLIEDPSATLFYANKITTDDLTKIDKSAAAYKIIYIHWGDEYSAHPSNNQIQLAHEFLRRGAVLVLGHHPHVLQGIEINRGRLIAYSLGNFIFDQNWSDATQLGLILKITLTDGKVSHYETKITKQTANYIPNIITSDPNGYLKIRSSFAINNSYKYAQYLRRREQWARRTMKKELIINLQKVSLATLIYPLLKRLPKLEKIFFYNRASKS